MVPNPVHGYVALVSEVKHGDCGWESMEFGGSVSKENGEVVKLVGEGGGERCGCFSCHVPPVEYGINVLCFSVLESVCGNGWRGRWWLACGGTE